MKYEMRYTVEKKKRAKTVRISRRAWHSFDEYRRFSFDAWCVLKDGKFFCEARSEAAANQICATLNNYDGLAGGL